MTIPAFGLGTFRLKDDVVIASVKTALELGYRAIDTAQIYDNEAAVGQAIEESGVARSELFITTKIWTENLSKDKLIPSLKESLEKLRTDYVDLTLIHWPSPNDAVSVEEFMQALLEAKEQGLTREIGISNFNCFHCYFICTRFLFYSCFFVFYIKQLFKYLVQALLSVFAVLLSYHF